MTRLVAPTGVGPEVGECEEAEQELRMKTKGEEDEEKGEGRERGETTRTKSRRFERTRWTFWKRKPSGEQHVAFRAGKK